MINLVTNNNFKSLSKEAIALYKRIGELSKKEVANAMKSIYQNELSQGYKQNIENINRTLIPEVSISILKPFNRAKTNGDLFEAIFNFEDKCIEEMITPLCKKLSPKKKSIPLEIEQEFYCKNNLLNDCMRWIHGMFARKSKQPEVIEIEKLLQEKYGLELVLLGDDLIIARHVLKAIEDAKRTGIKLPNEIIVSDYFGHAGMHLRTCNGSKNTILLSSSRFKNFQKKNCNIVNLTENEKTLLRAYKETCGYKNFNSTTSPEHVFWHEDIHDTHLPLLAFKHKKIPKKYLPTIMRLSGYTAMKPNATHEIYTELMTKKYLVGLNKEEEELLDYIINHL